MNDLELTEDQGSGSRVWPPNSPRPRLAPAREWDRAAWYRTVSVIQQMGELGLLRLWWCR